MEAGGAVYWTMNLVRLLPICLIVSLGACASHTGPAPAQVTLKEPVQAGHAIAERDCGGCHAIGADDRSRLPPAPAFRDLHKPYDVEGLAEALAEGIMVGHPAMPAKVYEPDQIRALISYLKSLEPPDAAHPSRR